MTPLIEVRRYASYIRRVCRGSKRISVGFGRATMLDVADLLDELAQGIEAATAGETTQIGSTEGESPVPPGMRPYAPSQPPKDQTHDK